MNLVIKSKTIYSYTCFNRKSEPPTSTIITVSISISFIKEHAVLGTLR